MVLNISEEKRTLIYRIVHYQNLEGLLIHGINCSNTENKIPNYINIGAKNLISKRYTHTVPVEPYGVLNDYVPFYFSPKSPMLFAIYKNPKEYGVLQSDIIFLVSYVEKIDEHNLKYVFNDGHFNFAFTEFYNKKEDLDKVDFDIMKKKVWTNTEDDTDRERRRQAEFLVHQSVPFDCIGAIISYNETVQKHVQDVLSKYSKTPYNLIRKHYYF